MATTDEHEPEQTITLIHEGEWWVAKDEETGVASQGKTRQTALENLDEAVELYQRDSGEATATGADEREMLRDIGLDPEEIEAARDEADELPEFME